MKHLNDPPSEVEENWRVTLQHDRIAHLIKDAFRCTSTSLQKLLKEHRVAYGHWTFLRILWQTDGLTQRQLSDQAGVTEPSTVLALRSMEKLGYIKRMKLEGNKKEIRVFLNPAGTALRSLCIPCAEYVNTSALKGISQENLNTTRQTLLAMIGNLMIKDKSQSKVKMAPFNRLKVK